MVYKTWCTIRQKLASFLWDASSKELVKIGEDEYYEERIIERDDKRYVLLRSVADPTAALVRRICEYYETIEDETELQGTLKEFKIQCDLTKRKSKNRCLAFIIAVVILTVAAIVGNSWLIRNWESSVFEHELICYCLIANNSRKQPCLQKKIYHCISALYIWFCNSIFNLSVSS